MGAAASLPWAPAAELSAAMSVPPRRHAGSGVNCFGVGRQRRRDGAGRAALRRAGAARALGIDRASPSVPAEPGAAGGRDRFAPRDPASASPFPRRLDAILLYLVGHEEWTLGTSCRGQAEGLSSSAHRCSALWSEVGRRAWVRRQAASCRRPTRAFHHLRRRTGLTKLPGAMKTGGDHRSAKAGAGFHGPQSRGRR